MARPGFVAGTSVNKWRWNGGLSTVNFLLDEMTRREQHALPEK
jgi:hypothetical protein